MSSAAARESYESDLSLLEDLLGELDAHAEKLREALPGHVGAVELTLHRMEGCGHAFFDETVRLNRVLDLLNVERVREEYDGFVVADLKHELDRTAEDIADWLTASELEARTEAERQLGAGATEEARTLAATLEERLGYDRPRIQAAFDQAVELAVDIYDPEGEARRVADSCRTAATNTLFLMLAALAAGGAWVAYPDSAAGPLPPFGLAGLLAFAAIAAIPLSRRWAKKSLQKRVAALREQLQLAFERRASREIEGSVRRLREVIEPLANDLRARAGIPPAEADS